MQVGVKIRLGMISDVTGSTSNHRDVKVLYLCNTKPPINVTCGHIG